MLSSAVLQVLHGQSVSCSLPGSMLNSSICSLWSKPSCSSCSSCRRCLGFLLSVRSRWANIWRHASDLLGSAMLTASVDLGRIKVAGKTPNLTLSLSSSLTIALPRSWSEVPTAEELCHASSTGNIWISKAGSCQIDILSLVNNQVPDATSLDPSIMTAIAGFLPECTVSPCVMAWIPLTFQVWKYTGLELRTNHAPHDGSDQNHAQASYFLHHPDLSSEMIAPPTIPWARFQGLTCTVSYDFRSPNSKANGKAQSVEQPPFNSLDLAQHAEEERPSHAYGLRSNPKRSRKATVAQEETNNVALDLSSTSHSQSEPSHDDHEREDTELLVSEAIGEMACLLDFAFRKLVGVKGASPGMRTIKSMRSPTLINIAPAVWDLQYLQVRRQVAHIDSR